MSWSKPMADRACGSRFVQSLTLLAIALMAPQTLDSASVVSLKDHGVAIENDVAHCRSGGPPRPPDLRRICCCQEAHEQQNLFYDNDTTYQQALPWWISVYWYHRRCIHSVDLDAFAQVRPPEVDSVASAGRRDHLVLEDGKR